MGESLKVVAGSDKGEVVGEKCLPIHLALDRAWLVVEQMQVVVDHAVFGSQPRVYRDC